MGQTLLTLVDVEFRDYSNQENVLMIKCKLYYCVRVRGCVVHMAGYVRRLEKTIKEKKQGSI